MKKTLAYIRVVAVIIITAAHIGLLLLTNLVKMSPAIAFGFRRSWARWAGRILGVNIELKQFHPIDQPVIYVSNHRSMIDPVIQAKFINAHIIAKKEVSQIPVINKGAQLTGIIFVSRDKLSSRLAARNETERLLLEGKSVLVYAEGTTGTERTTIDFKPGTLVIAAQLGIPVVPIAIDYKHPNDYWYSDGLRSQMIRQIGKPRTYARMSILPAIHHNDSKELLSLVKGAIDQELIQFQTNWSDVFRD